MPGKVLFSARLVGAQAAAETSMHFKYTMCRRGGRESIVFHFIHEMNIEDIIKAPVLDWEPFKLTIKGHIS